MSLLLAGVVGTMWLLAALVGAGWLPGSNAYADEPDPVEREAEAVEFAFTQLGEDELAATGEERREAREHYNPERLRFFFASFDADGDGELDPEEARAFYTWVEDNVTYRHDDENATAEIEGTPVGDGRPGNDYQQSPRETFDERMGDCEDTSTLHVAFHTYWGNTAYQVLVNTEPGEGISHAPAIVEAEAVEGLEEPEGGFHTYTFAEGNQHGVEAGTYVVVDNTYSDTFGTISGGIEDGTFQIHGVETLTDALKRSNDWRGP